MHQVTRLSFLAAIALATILSGCDNKGQEGGSSSSSGTSGTAETGGASGQSFTLGLAGPFTGNSSEFGSQIKMGVQLFADELNAAGGLNGRHLNLNVQDDGGKADQA